MQGQVDNVEFREFSRKRPGGSRGAVTYADSLFIHSKIQESKPKLLVEIGIAAGISSATMLHSMQKLNNDSKLYAFDIMEKCFFDDSKEVGFAVNEMIDKDFVANRYVKNVPSSVFEFDKYFEPDSIDFIFIDANHRHPWPSIDILVALPYLKEGCTVCLHDINLPLKNKKFPNYGVKNVFDKLENVKKDNSIDDIPNCGSFVIENKSNVESQVKGIFKYCKWEENLNEEVTNKLKNLGLLD